VLQARDIVAEARMLAAVCLAESIAAIAVQQALVDVHGAAGVAGKRLGHEAGLQAVLAGQVAQRAFEQKHLIGQLQRRAVLQVQLVLAVAYLVQQGVGGDALLVAVLFQLGKERFVLPGVVQRVGRRHRLALAAVGGQQVKLDFRRHDWCQAIGGKRRQHTLEHVARRKRHRRALAVVTIVDQLGNAARVAGFQAQCTVVG